MANKKPDSHAARKNLPKLAGLVAGVVLLIVLAYIYHLNGFGETFATQPTSTPQASETPTTQPSFTPTIEPTQTPILPTETPTVEAPIVSNSIQDLKPENILLNKPAHLLKIASDNLNNIAIRGSTYGVFSMNWGGREIEWLVAPVILKGSEAKILGVPDKSINIPTDKFAKCGRKNFRECKIDLSSITTQGWR